MDTSSESKKFEIPPGFQEVEGSSTLYLEDVEDEDTELWIIQAPLGVDMTRLEHQIINFQGQTQISFDDDNISNLECFANEYDSDNEHGYHMVLPRKSDKKLYNVPRAFKGHIRIMENVDLPDFKMPEWRPREIAKVNGSDIDSGINEDDIKQSISPDIPKKKRKKHKTRIAEEPVNESNYAAVGTNIVSQAAREENENSKRKHKKSKKHDHEFESSTVKMELPDLVAESNENFQAPSNEDNDKSERKTNKHKKKKKNLNQMSEPTDFANIEIKTELDFANVSKDTELEKKLRDGSSIIEERKRKKKHKRESKEQEQVPMSIGVEIKEEAGDLVLSPSETCSISKKAKKKKKKKKHENE